MAPRSRSNPALYNTATLSVYTVLIHLLSHRPLWGVENQQIEALYDRHMAVDHVEVGPGNGRFLVRALRRRRRAGREPVTRVALLDLNPAALAVTARRLRRRGVQVDRHLTDALAPWPVPAPTREGRSVGCVMVTHTLPGEGFAAKREAFAQMVRAAGGGGRLFGCGILGEADPAPISRAGARMRRLYNGRKNIFHNTGDTAQGLEDVLRQVCGPAAHITVRTVGAVVVWEVVLP
ncbi:class I SAM-dependent methyltransferase [Nocardiopsis changdeensis]|uniref:Class I SAM-dependent methyltransferase n=1 Tax=Nocardiopsis changdeensis TaxID=2831969 RepID=A0A975QCN7_9ACTN|nr:MULTISPECIES: class I SAM-dependent methyltransferase [Nocardiopsis]QUX26485.1 class I SAM-dependent methyltransferase [Nocardiopsis changdeensis]QYX40757.1 class I SAM-dependent methyltransferase [Nocardiopsis sp. MT53]